MMWMTLGFSLLFFLFMYKFVPLLLATEIGRTFPAMHGRLTVNLMDGVLRLVIFLGFLFVLSKMKDIRRTFEYHGAEHKVVFNFESGQPVRLKTRRSSSRFTRAVEPVS